MTRIRLPALMFALLIPAGLALQACNDGPAENAGEKVDRALGQNDPTEKGPGEKAGEKIDDATNQ